MNGKSSGDTERVATTGRLVTRRQQAVTAVCMGLGGFALGLLVAGSVFGGLMGLAVIAPFALLIVASTSQLRVDVGTDWLAVSKVGGRERVDITDLRRAWLTGSRYGRRDVHFVDGHQRQLHVRLDYLLHPSVVDAVRLALLPATPGLDSEMCSALGLKPPKRRWPTPERMGALNRDPSR